MSEETSPIILITRMLRSLEREFKDETMLTIPRETLMALLSQMKDMIQILEKHGIEPNQQ
jgi:hypothetical protein